MSERGFFEHEIAVADADIDELGHVNNAVYLRYAEACGRAHSDGLGLSVEAFRKLGAVPVIRKHVVHYYRPALAGDRLRVSTRVVALGGARATRHNQIHRAVTGELLVDVLTEWVWLEPASKRPRRVPAAVVKAFGMTAEPPPQH